MTGNQQPVPDRSQLRRNWRTFTLGFGAARCGDWIYTVALNWAVLQRTESLWLLGITNACRLLPFLLLTVPAGLLADHVQRRTWLSRLYLGLSACTLLVAANLNGQFSFGLLAFAVTAQACLSALEAPIRTRYLGDLVGYHRWSRALALQAALTDSASMVGPFLGGFLVAAIGPELSLVIAAALLFGFPLVLTRLPRAVMATWRRQPEAREATRELWNCLAGSTLIRRTALFGLLPLTFGSTYTAMMPMISRDLHGFGPQGLGAMMSCAAAGSLLTSILMSRHTEPYENGRFAALCCLTLGLGLTALVLAPSNPILLALSLVVIGASGQAYRTVVRILLQSLAPAALQGSVVSLGLLDRGLIPVGVLVVSGVATHWGPQVGGLMMGLGVLTTLGVLLARWPDLAHLRITRKRWRPAGEGYALEPISRDRLKTVTVAFSDREYGVLPALALSPN